MAMLSSISLTARNYFITRCTMVHDIIENIFAIILSNAQLNPLIKEMHWSSYPIVWSSQNSLSLSFEQFSFYIHLYIYLKVFHCIANFSNKVDHLHASSLTKYYFLSMKQGWHSYGKTFQNLILIFFIWSNQLDNPIYIPKPPSRNITFTPSWFN